MVVTSKNNGYLIEFYNRLVEEKSDRVMCKNHGLMDYEVNVVNDIDGTKQLRFVCQDCHTVKY